MTLKKYQKDLDDLHRRLGWRYWSPLSILARLTEEVGEFARLVNHVFGDKRKKEGETLQDFEDEIGDIMYALICFANANHLDLDRAVKRSLKKADTRDKKRY